MDWAMPARAQPSGAAALALHLPEPGIECDSAHFRGSSWQSAVAKAFFGLSRPFESLLSSPSMLTMLELHSMFV